MRPVLGELGFGNQWWTGIMFLRGEGRQSLQTRGNWREEGVQHAPFMEGTFTIIFLWNTSFQTSWCMESWGPEDGFSGAVGELECRESTDHSYVHSCPKINQTWLDFESSQFFVYDCQGGSTTPPNKLMQLPHQEGRAEGRVVEIRNLEGNRTSWPLLVSSLMTCAPSTTSC